MLRTWMTVLIMSVSAPVVWAADDKKDEASNPVAILKKVDAAAKAVSVAKYKARFQGLDEAESRLAKVEGEVILAGWLGNTPKKYLVHARVRQPGSSEVKKVTIGSDGENYYVIDHENQKAYVDIDPAVIGRTGRPAAVLFTLEFVHPTPFSDEINGDKQELLGTESIGGVDCFKIHVVYANGIQEAIWHFGKKDFLPRQRVDMFRNPQGEVQKQQRTLMDLVVDPELDEDTFKFKLPDGYERVDDFAP